jgi:DNA-binding NarL/FixJ family response regulator
MKDLRETLITQHLLTNREAEVSELVCQGLTSKQIGAKLFVTEKTIKFHLTHIYKKMRLNSRAQLIVHCINMMMPMLQVEVPQPAIDPSGLPVGERKVG